MMKSREHITTHKSPITPRPPNKMFLTCSELSLSLFDPLIVILRDLLIPSMVAMHLYKPLSLTTADTVILLAVNVTTGVIEWSCCCSITTATSASLSMKSSCIVTSHCSLVIPLDDLLDVKEVI